MRFRLWRGLAACVLLLGGAKAKNILVLNPSFEETTSPPLTSPGQYTTYPGPGNTIPDWSNAPGSGVQYYKTPLNSANGFEYTTVRDGVDGAYSDSSLISQQLSSTLEAGTYTLTIASGWRGGRNYAGGTFGLYTPNAQLAAANFVQPVVQGTFLDSSLSVTILPTNAEMGQPLVIRMVGAGLDGGTIDFDDVRLMFEAAPEPSTWLLLGLGGATLTGMAFRRRQVC